MSAIFDRALLALGLLLSLILLPVLPAQAGELAVQTELRGRALDANRAAVAGARVVALRNGAEVTSTVTNGQGDFLSHSNLVNTFLEFQHPVSLTWSR